MSHPLIFNTSVAQQKPSNADACPFCDRSQLARILDEKEDMLWLDNKYQTVAGAYQTLIIETNDHNAHLATYSKAKAHAVISYLYDCWAQLEKQADYQSVIAFKNFGPLSGGSLEHSHSQIVAFKNRNAYEQLDASAFAGELVRDENGVQLTISDQPLMGFVEFNVTAPTVTPDFAAIIQQVAAYVLEGYFHGLCQSYNLFFYKEQGLVICKLIPRFIASPYFVGYGFSMVHDQERLTQIKHELQLWLAKH